MSFFSGGADYLDIRLFLGSCFICWFCSFDLKVEMQLVLKINGFSTSLGLLMLGCSGLVIGGTLAASLISTTTAGSR